MLKFTPIMFQGANIGNFFDIFIGHVFKRGKLRFNIFSSKKKIQYRIEDGYSIENWNNQIYLRDVFLQFFQKVIANPEVGFSAAPKDQTNQAVDAIHAIKKKNCL